MAAGQVIARLAVLQVRRLTATGTATGAGRPLGAVR
jgi:hypothetical protein